MPYQVDWKRFVKGAALFVVGLLAVIGSLLLSRDMREKDRATAGGIILAALLAIGGGVAMFVGGGEVKESVIWVDDSGEAVTDETGEPIELGFTND